MCLMFYLVGFDRTGARTNRFDVFKIFLKNEKRLSNLVLTNRSILLRNNKATTFYSFFVRIIFESLFTDVEYAR